MSNISPRESLDELVPRMAQSQIISIGRKNSGTPSQDIFNFAPPDLDQLNRMEQMIAALPNSNPFGNKRDSIVIDSVSVVDSERTMEIRLAQSEYLSAITPRNNAHFMATKLKNQNSRGTLLNESPSNESLLTGKEELDVAMDRLAKQKEEAERAKLKGSLSTSLYSRQFQFKHFLEKVHESKNMATDQIKMQMLQSIASEEEELLKSRQINSQDGKFSQGFGQFSSKQQFQPKQLRQRGSILRTHKSLTKKPSELNLDFLKNSQNDQISKWRRKHSLGSRKQLCERVIQKFHNPKEQIPVVIQYAEVADGAEDELEAQLSKRVRKQIVVMLTPETSLLTLKQKIRQMLKITAKDQNFMMLYCKNKLLAKERTIADVADQVAADRGREQNSNWLFITALGL